MGLFTKGTKQRTERSEHDQFQIAEGPHSRALYEATIRIPGKTTWTRGELMAANCDVVQLVRARAILPVEPGCPDQPPPTIHEFLDSETAKMNPEQLGSFLLQIIRDGTARSCQLGVNGSSADWRREAEARFPFTAETLPMLLAAADESHNVEYANAAFRLLMQFPADKIAGGVQCIPALVKWANSKDGGREKAVRLLAGVEKSERIFSELWALRNDQEHAVALEVGKAVYGYISGGNKPAQ